MVVTDMIIIAAFLPLGAGVLAAMLWGTAQVSRFLADHPRIRDAKDLEDFKIFVKRDMIAALTLMPFALILVAGSVYIVVQLGFLGFVINLVLLVPWHIANGRLKPLVTTARNLECSSEELTAEHRRIAGIWKNNVLPRFESQVRVGWLGWAPMYL